MNEQRTKVVVDEMHRLQVLIVQWRQAGSNQGTKESGAVRRASMDLTRALADLRRPW